MPPRSTSASPTKKSKSKKSPAPPTGLKAKCKALLRQGAEAVFGDLSVVGFKHLLLQAVNLGLIITSALIIWKSLILFTGSESPVVVVLSGSMEPAFHRGDILFLSSAQKGPPVNSGDIVVFNIGGRDIPIVHRVVKVHDGGEMMATGTRESINEKSGKPETKPTGGPFLLTKGDNNWGDDRALYARGQRWLRGSEHVMGRVVGFLPHVGRVTIVMNDYPAVKYVLIGVLALFVVTSKE